ncbi:MAG: peptide chain release factor N(5)-glutamine methyltransferase [Leptolyngbyaceae cyanobacterium bins.302]|nr:peptide chain release factor N(5)-glutamine methyltransferase [Leptolyngbyaceae cyanobacterium bins.302]
MAQPSSKQDELSFLDQEREFVVSGKDLWDWWQWARQEAIAYEISPNEADWLLQALTNLDRLALRLGSFQDRDQVQLKVPQHTLKSLWQQRIKQRVPVQYLVGETTWREFSLQVSPAVLIPRPETELLIDLAITHSPTHSCSHWTDLGTGSGAIALGLATAFPDATIHAVDVSAEALAIAQANAAAYQLIERIHFYQGSWLEPLSHLKGQLSGMVSNPPYIPSQQVLELQLEVTQHEPHLALDGGTDGLDCIRQLVAAAPDYLQSGGLWMVEMMAGQAEAVVDLLQQNGNYIDIQIHHDLAGIERFAIARRT